MAKVVYTAPGYTIAEVEALLAAATGLAVATGAELTKMDQAITAAGQAASTWDGAKWWWLDGTASFATVADSSSYNLRVVDEDGAEVGDKVMADAWTVKRIYYDANWPLNQMPWEKYRQWLILGKPNESTSKPLSYAITGEAPVLHLRPVPDAAYTLYIDYIKRHSKITSADSLDTALIIPSEFQHGIYVNGATWLLRHETLDPGSLRKCDGFMEAISRMHTAHPEGYDPSNDSNNFRDAQSGNWPHNRRVLEQEGGYLIQNDVSV